MKAKPQLHLTGETFPVKGRFKYRWIMGVWNDLWFPCLWYFTPHMAYEYSYDAHYADVWPGDLIKALNEFKPERVSLTNAVH
jgi:hypothetical protein